MAERGDPHFEFPWVASRAQEAERQVDEQLNVLLETCGGSNAPADYVRSIILCTNHIGQDIPVAAEDGGAAVLEAFRDLFDEAEREYPGERVWDKLKGYMADQLCLARNPIAAMQLHVTIRRMDMLVNAVHGVGAVAERQMPGFGNLYTQVQRQLVDRELGRTSERQLEFRRHERNYIIDTGRLDGELLGILEERERAIAEQVGETYDPIADWVELERTTYAPGANWEEFGALAINAALWPEDLPTPLRLRVLHASAMLELGYVHPPVVKAQAFEFICAGLDAFDIETGCAPAIDELRRIIALSLFDHNHPQQGYKLAREIGNRAVTGEVAQGLLVRGRADEAKHVLVDTTDTDVVMHVIAHGSWPDQKAAQKFKKDIFTLNKFMPEWRARCMESQAVMEEEAGNDELARQLRYKANLLRRQVEKGIVKYKQPKR